VHDTTRHAWKRVNGEAEGRGRSVGKRLYRGLEGRQAEAG
jgi:hypothetical protein